MLLRCKNPILAVFKNFSQHIMTKIIDSDLYKNAQNIYIFENIASEGKELNLKSYFYYSKREKKMKTKSNKRICAKKADHSTH